MLIHSTRFGQIEVDNADVIQFPYGIPGFPEEKAFILLPYKPDSPFHFLQSVSDPDLSFLIVNPFDFFAQYEFQMDDQLVEKLGFSEENPPAVYSIVTVRGKVEDMTANLLAPLVINHRGKSGAQLILEKSTYTTKHFLFPKTDQSAASEGGK